MDVLRICGRLRRLGSAGLKTPDKLRKEAERQRMKAKGFKRFEAWLHPEDWPKVRELIERLTKKRA